MLLGASVRDARGGPGNIFSLILASELSLPLLGMGGGVQCPSLSSSSLLPSGREEYKLTCRMPELDMQTKQSYKHYIIQCML